MNCYTIYTPHAIYTDVYAYSVAHAKKMVWKQTFGHEKPETMTVVLTRKENSAA